VCVCVCVCVEAMQVSFAQLFSKHLLRLCGAKLKLKCHSTPTHTT
jgi:hypothetical protein